MAATKTGKLAFYDTPIRHYTSHRVVQDCVMLDMAVHSINKTQMEALMNAFWASLIIDT